MAAREGLQRGRPISDRLLGPMRKSRPFDFVRVERSDPIVTVVIDRPEALNALNLSILRGLSAAFEEIARDDRIRGVVLTGGGDRSFVSGADIGELLELSPATAPDFFEAAHGAFHVIERLSKPVVAAVGGFALGGGCELALACHLRVASRDAVFALPEVGLGAIPGFGGTVRLPRLIGTGRALEMILTARRVDADEARDIGLVYEVVDRGDLLARSTALLSEILAKGPLAVSAALESVYRGLDAPLDAALSHESAQFTALLDTEDLKEGMRAFLDRRSPRFLGR